MSLRDPIRDSPGNPSDSSHSELARLRAALDSSADAIYLVDRRTMRFVDVNDAAVRILGFARDEFLQMGPQDIDVRNSRRDIEQRYDDLITTGQLRSRFRTNHRSKDGTVFPVELQIGLHRWNDQVVVIGVGRDITDGLRAEREMQRLNADLDRLVRERDASLSTARHELQLMTRVMDSVLNGVVITDAAGNIQRVNQSFTAVTGYVQDEVEGETPRVLKSGHHDEAFYRTMWSTLQARGEWKGEIWNRRKSGAVYPEWLSIRALYDDEGTITNYVAVLHDLSELRAKEDEVFFQANHDALTGLCNRGSLIERMDASLRGARRNGTGVSVAVVDIDGFRRINDTAGHRKGDFLLREIALQLEWLLGDRATVARIGGDEFGVLLEEVGEEKAYVDASERIANLFERPLELEDSVYEVSVSIGMAVFPGDGDEATALLHSAELALYQAKQEPPTNRRGRIGMFTPALNAALQRRFTLEARIREDLERGRFVPYYQPRVELASGRIVGVEALARWIQSDGSEVSPGDFIPLAEETGLIHRLGEVILSQVIADCRGILDASNRGLRVAVNASVKELQDHDYSLRLADLLEAANDAPDTLEIEITESAIMQDIGSAMPVLDRLKQLGATIAIDDFGTGYSSLYYLKRLPIDVLKIDKSFVDDIINDPDDRAIVATIIAMAEAMGLRLVAEGIETREQAELLTRWGCAEGQGYYFGKPMCIEQLAPLLQSQSLSR
jgi:diguanylate cyclase (GGDEF)-like protein/PAS domain S-box-containing protein